MTSSSPTRRENPSTLSPRRLAPVGPPLLSPMNLAQPHKPRLLLRFHDLRHTFVTHCDAAGVPQEQVPDWVGHTHTRMTDPYRATSTGAEIHALQALYRYEYAASQERSMTSLAAPRLQRHRSPPHNHHTRAARSTTTGTTSRQLPDVRPFPVEVANQPAHSQPRAIEPGSASALAPRTRSRLSGSTNPRLRSTHPR